MMGLQIIIIIIIDFIWGKQNWLKISVQFFLSDIDA